MDDGAQKLPTRVCRVGQNHIPIHTVYDRIFGDFPAKSAVYAPHIYMALANPTRLFVGEGEPEQSGDSPGLPSSHARAFVIERMWMG